MSSADAALDFTAVSEAQALLQELARVGDFPALSQVISRVSHIANSENSRNHELTDAILRDLSLTNKLLRVVNSVYFSQFGDRDINTISRAIIILGFNSVRDAAVSLMFFEHMKNHAQGAELKIEAVDSFFCGMIGRSLAAREGLPGTEEVLICSLFRNLGRMVCRLHFYEKAKQVDRLVADQGLSEEAASNQVFGLTYDEISQALGRIWNLPKSLLRGMAPLPPGPIKGGDETARVQILANLAHEIYSVVRGESPEALPKAISEMGKRYGQAISLRAETLAEVIHASLDAMEKEAQILDVDLKASPTLSHLLDERREVKQTGREEAAENPAVADAMASAEAAPETGPDGDPTGILIAGLQDLTCLLLEEAPSADLLHVAAELLYRSRCFDNVVICTITANGKELVGRIGFGANAERTRLSLHIPTAFTPDVFHAAVSKNADLLIADTGAESIRKRIPGWYAEKIGARSFLLLPITVGGRTVAIIYGDKRDATLQLQRQTMALIKSLRNQLALALRQTATH